MSWPVNLKKVKCKGFNSVILPAIKNALDRDLVEWGDCHSWIDESIGHFKWSECEWEIIEVRELVKSIELIVGNLDNPDLTVMVLRG